MIIFNLDGVLADYEHRRHFIDVDKAIEKEIAYEDVYCNIGGVQSNGYFLSNDPDRRWKPDWRAYDETCHLDGPIIPSIRTLIALSRECICPITKKVISPIEIWTGRYESIRSKTEYWINNNVYPFQWNSRFLKMRPMGNTESECDLKECWLNERCADLLEAKINGINPEKHDIEMVFESDPESIEMWKRRGIFVFDCRQKD